jgi:arylsulfatase A-like enzyme
MRRPSALTPLIAAVLATAPAHAVPVSRRPHNLILFVADGLRGGIVSPQTAPAMAALAKRGIAFPNSHSLFPTFTTANASALATGHYLGDTGDFSNTIYAGFPVAAAKGSVTPFIENDPILAELDSHFRGNYLDEETLLEAARAAGYGTAAIGKLGPARIQDHRDVGALVIDDATGSTGGVPLPDAVMQAIAAAGLPTTAPGRGANGKSGDAHTPGTLTANIDQQAWFTAVASRAVLPLLAQHAKPFVMVYWSRDPDGSQHNQGDSLGKLIPGINGPTSIAAIRNADDNLAALEAALKAHGLFDTTDIIVTADHGFSTISKTSHTSAAASGTYPDVVAGELPPGFVALDLAAALNLAAFDPDAANAPLAPGVHPSRGNALLGSSAETAQVIVAANGGSDLIYLPQGDRALARRAVAALLAQDYTGALFVDDALGPIAGALPLSAINFVGAARTPRPAIVVGFRTFTTGCAVPTNCQVEIADTALQTGQGMHGSLGRGDTFNFMAAAGPDFRRGWRDPAPTSNADLGRTMAHVLGLRIAPHGHLLGRVLSEAMPGGQLPRTTNRTLTARASANGLATTLHGQGVGITRYYDSATLKPLGRDAR